MRAPRAFALRTARKTAKVPFFLSEKKGVSRRRMTEWHPLRTSTQDGSARWQELTKVAELRAREIEPAKLPSLDHMTMSDFDHVMNLKVFHNNVYIFR